MNGFERKVSKSFINLGLFSDKNDDIDKSIVEICAGCDSTIITSVRNCVSMHSHGLPILPEGLLQYGDHLYQYSGGNIHHLNFIDLEAMLASVPCVLKNGEKWEKIVHVRFPPHQVTRHVQRNILDSLSISTIAGCQAVGTDIGINSLDYIVPKHDGINIKSMCVSTPSADFYFYVYANNWCMRTQQGYVFSGEIVDDKIILTMGSEVLITFPATVTLHTKTYELIPTTPINVEKFKNAKEDDRIDGFIVSINGVEYKIKWENTIDVIYSSLEPHFVRTRNGTRFEVDNIDTSRLSGIYECTDMGGIIYIIRPRLDKLTAQSDEEIALITNSPTVEYLQQLMINVSPNISYPHRDILPPEVIAYRFSDWIKPNVYSSWILITRNLFIEFCKKMGYQIDSDIVQDVRKIMFPVGTWGNHHYTEFKQRMLKYKQCVKYANCTDVYRILSEIGVAESLLDLARQISKAGYIISIRKLWLMICRGELMLIGNSVMPVRCGGVKQSFKSFIPPRPIVSNTTGYVQAMQAYFKNNVRRFIIEDTALMFHQAAQLIKQLHEDDRARVGEMIVLFGRALMVCYDPQALENDNSYFWQLILQSESLSAYIKKIEHFIEIFECVENHGITDDHICSNGVHFRKAINHVVSSPFVESK